MNNQRFQTCNLRYHQSQFEERTPYARYTQDNLGTVSLMIENPILIKRTLIRVDGMSIQGFTDERLTPYLGLWDGKDDVITCLNLQTISCDDSK